jgi:hypothetical protein
MTQLLSEVQQRRQKSGNADSTRHESPRRKKAHRVRNGLAKLGNSNHQDDERSAKWRQLRHNFLGGDMAYRDGTGWPGMLDSNSQMFKKSHLKGGPNFLGFRDIWDQRLFTRIAGT